jgi:hypothetical protein
MNSSENIRNALQVIYKTYENVQKLMDYAKIVAVEKTDYVLSSPKFLRRKSDNDTSAWLINDFILLFQNDKDPDCESGNGWRDGAIYAIEIYLGDEDNEPENLPAINLSKFEYQNINSWSERCSPANHWVFYYPLWNLSYMDFEEANGYSIAVPKNDSASKTYWGLKKVTTKTIDLFDVTSDNLQELIFGSFDKLYEMK